MSRMTTFRAQYSDFQLLSAFPKINQLGKYREAFIQTIREFDSSHRGHAGDPTAISIPYQTLRARFGRRGFEAANDAADGLIVVSNNWHLNKHLTRRFNPSDELAEFFANEDIDIEGRHPLLFHGSPLTRPPPSPILSRDINGRNVSLKINLGGMSWQVPINVDSLQWLISVLEEWRAHLVTGGPRPGHLNKEISERLEQNGINNALAWIDRCWRSSRHLLQLVHTSTLEIGNLPQVYCEHAMGRLYIQGVSLQTVPSIVRRAATDGYWEYDLSNCHFAILQQLAKKKGLPCDRMREYLNNKEPIRGDLARKCEVPVKKVKQALIALVYGTNPNNRQSVLARSDNLTEEGRQVFAADPFVRGLYQEMKPVKEYALSIWRGRGGLSNAVGKRPEKGSRDSMVAHVLQGYEAQMLRAVLPHVRDLVVAQHDGFTCVTRHDTALFQRELSRLTGFNMRMEEVQINTHL